MNNYKELKIVKVEIFKMNIPLHEPFIISSETIYNAQNTLIQITTNEGITGIGESSPFLSINGETQETNWHVGQLLAKQLLQKNPLSIENCLTILDKTITGNLCIKSAFDMALYDIAAQYVGLPLFAFLGGKNDKEIVTDMTVSIGSPEKMANDSAKLKNSGFPAIKVKLGTNFSDDLNRIKAIREAVGLEIPIRIDANRGWNISTANRLLKALEPFHIEYCEAPIPTTNLRHLIRLRNNSPIPIMADESLFDHYDAYKLASTEACDFFNIKLAKSGGIIKALKIIAIAEAAGIPCQVGCFSESRIGITALAHLVMARNNIIYFDMDSPLMHSEDPVTGGIEYGEKGKIILPDSTGLGVQIKNDHLKKLEKVEIISASL